MVNCKQREFTNDYIEFAGESEEDEDEEQENYYQQIKKMQLKDDIPNNFK